MPTMLEALRRDLARCAATPAARVRHVLETPATWAVLGYRFRRAVLTVPLPRPLRAVRGLAARAVKVAVEVATNIELPFTAEIGPGLELPHIGYVIVSSHAKIGANCTLTQGVTLGHARGGQQQKSGDPVLGDRVYVGPGAAVIGPVTVGDDALIGPGAVVTRSVPARAVVVGNPARILSYRGSFDLIAYPGMEADPARVASLALSRQEEEARRAGAAGPAPDRREQD
jgi:serine O-acetyltransferase